MASNRPRDTESLLFTPKTPHFFKIILDGTVQAGNLMIPRKFVRKYGTDLRSPAVLKVPSGAVWNVELTKCDGEVFMRSGWREFMEYYSIVCGHFVVFKYEESSNFSVTIFDRSASEIEYPYRSTNNEECSDNDEESQKEETEASASVELLDENLPCLKRRDKAPQSCPGPHKLRRTNSTAKTEKSLEQQCSRQGLRAGASGTKCVRPKKSPVIDMESDGSVGDVRGVPGRMHNLTRKERATAVEKASAFKSINPFFVVAMHSSYIDGRGGVNLPFQFVKKYFNRKCSKVILGPSDGRTWTIKYHAEVYNAVKKPGFSSKWVIFAKEDNLRVGDSVPWKFIEKLIKQIGGQNEMQLALQVGDKSWPIKLRSYPQHEQGKLMCGWSAFARENSLQNGDTCIFELIDKDDAFLKVSIFKHVD